MSVRRDPSPRALGLTFLLVAVGAAGLLALSWQASLLDRYEFRQLQTALGAYWIAEEGWRFNYLLPLFGPPWSVPMEFPTYQVMVAWLHGLTGWPLEQSGRLVGILALALTLPAVFDLLAVTGLRRSRRLIVLMVILSSPVYLFYARAFMIETTALGLALWFLACFRRALIKPLSLWTLAALGCAVLAALTKVTTFLVYGLPALALALTAWRERPGAAKGLGVAQAGISLLIASLALGLTAWWIAHGDSVKDSNPFTGFLTARELHAWNYGPWSLRVDWSFWLKMQETIVGYNLAEGAIALALLAGVFATRRARGAAAVALAGFFSGPLVFANLYHVHDYYYAANALLLAAAAGLLLASAWDNPRLPRAARWLALGLMLLFQAQSFYRGYYSHHRQPAPPPPALAGVIRDAVPADGVVLILGADWDPLLAYYSQRRTLMVPGEREGETAVLEDVVARLAPHRIAALVVQGDRVQAQTELLRAYTQRFGFAPQPVARQGPYALYLPADRVPSTLPPLPGGEWLALPAADAWAAALNDDDLSSLDLSRFAPAPVAARSGYGLSAGSYDDQAVLFAHAPAELIFTAAAPFRTLEAVLGLQAAAYARGGPAVTDGVTVEVYGRNAAGLLQRVYHRELDPARRPADRGPQTLRLTFPDEGATEVRLRLGVGPHGNPTNDWAYVARVELY